MSGRLSVGRRLIADMFADSAKRQHGDALDGRDGLSGAILRSLSAHVAVLDRRGVIIAVNEPWRRRRRGQGSAAYEVIAAGVDYLAMLAASARHGGHRAAEALAGVEAVCAGRQAAFELEYRCDVSGDERWFQMTVSPLRHDDGGAVVVHVDITARKRAEIALRESEDRFRRLTEALRDLSGRLIGAQEQERARIGRELHDNVSQRLALLAMRIDVLRNSVPAGAEDTAAGLASLSTATSDISREVHALSHRLHSIKLEALGLVSALRAHCRELSQHGIHVRFSAANVQNRLPSDIALCLFRVAQEALANVVQHSGVTDARVELSGGTNEIVLRVADGGRGFDPAGPSDGLGLTSMRERVRLLGGSITVNSRPNGGTVVEVQVAIPAATPSATRPPSAA
jgi:signal transduction histidine kinase